MIILICFSLQQKPVRLKSQKKMKIVFCFFDNPSEVSPKVSVGFIQSRCQSTDVWLKTLFKLLLWLSVVLALETWQVKNAGSCDSKWCLLLSKQIFSQNWRHDIFFQVLSFFLTFSFFQSTIFVSKRCIINSSSFNFFFLSIHNICFEKVYHFFFFLAFITW